MRKIKVYEQLSTYAQRMLDLMHNDGFTGLEDDIYENEDSWVIKHVYMDDEAVLTEIQSMSELDRKLSTMLINFVIEEIKCGLHDPINDVEEISMLAEMLVR